MLGSIFNFVLVLGSSFRGSNAVGGLVAAGLLVGEALGAAATGPAAADGFAGFGPDFATVALGPDGGCADAGDFCAPGFGLPEAGLAAAETCGFGAVAAGLASGLGGAAGVVPGVAGG